MRPDQVRNWDAAASGESDLVTSGAGEGLYRLTSIAVGEVFHRAILPDLTTGSVLEVGCGKGRWLRVLAEAGFAVIGGDRSASMLDRAKSLAPVAQLAAQSLPFRDRSVDNAMTVTVLQHLPDPLAAIDELARIARNRIAIYELTGTPVPNRLSPDTRARSIDWYRGAFESRGWRLRHREAVEAPGPLTMLGGLPAGSPNPRLIARALMFAMLRHTWFVFEPRGA